jgi:hypothetical protein
MKTFKKNKFFILKQRTNTTNTLPISWRNDAITFTQNENKKKTIAIKTFEQNNNLPDEISCKPYKHTFH